MPGLKIFIISNGCDRRMLDASRLEEYFRVNGCSLIKTPERADYIVFVTCAFTGAKEQDCFRILSKYSRLKGKLVILGCLPGIAPERLNKEFNGLVCLKTEDLGEIDGIFQDFKVKIQEIAESNNLFRDIPLINKMMTKLEPTADFIYKCIITARYKMKNPGSSINCSRNRKGVYLRIGWGCPMNCSYCAIRSAVGPLRSKAPEECFREYEALLHAGQRSFIITADNAGAYGLDIGSSFSELLDGLSRIDTGHEVSWIISELHPVWMIRYRDSLLKNIEKNKITEILCSVQTGSDRISKLMNRETSSADMRKTLRLFRDANDRLELILDVIIGFPTETDEDFMESLDLICKAGASHVNFFAYSDREKTVASGLSGKTGIPDIHRRLRIAMKILGKKKIDLLYL
ncbi:MAG: radical SAM protein [Elusimicrobiota bacterium]